MDVIALLIPLALLLAGIGLAACVTAIRSGQYDDLTTPPLRILVEDVRDPAGVTPDEPRQGLESARQMQKGEDRGRAP